MEEDAGLPRGELVHFFFLSFVRAVLIVRLFLVLFLLVLVGKDDEMDWVSLRHFQFGIAFRAAQNLAFFDFVFVQIDLGVTFGTFRHGLTLLKRLFNRRAYYITPVSSFAPKECLKMTGHREYPQRPVIGVGGVVISENRTLLIRRGAPPLEGEWSIPGGTLELGETLAEGVQRELAEETGIEVRVLNQIEVFERIFRDASGKPKYHFVVFDYFCQMIGGNVRAGSDATDVAWVAEPDLAKYSLTSTATRVIEKAFQMAREIN